LKKQAQSIIEASVAFIIISIIFFCIAECASFWRAKHSLQAFIDEVNANLVLEDRENLCLNPSDRVIDLIDKKAQKYLERQITLNGDIKSANLMKLVSQNLYRGRHILTLRVLCDDKEGVSTQADYIYRGLFVFTTGYNVSGISSVQTPQF